jgi:two-component system LytT family response regulator
LFLDIQMPGKSGFEILGELRRAGVKPCVIFVTAFENFAIRAIKASAFDYILKPVDRSELAVAVERAIARINDTESERNFSLLLEMTSRKKLRFNTAGGFILIDPSDIIYVQADWNYSEIHLGKEKHEVVVVNIGEIEKMLPPQEFARISRSVIVNLKYLSKGQRIKRLCILNKDGEVFQFRIPLLRIRDLEKLL